MEIYAFPKWLIAITPFAHEPRYDTPERFLIDYLELWLPRARAFLPFGVAREFVHRRCARAPVTFTSNHDVPATYLCRLPHQLRQIISRMVTRRPPAVRAVCACTAAHDPGSWREPRCSRAACESKCVCSITMRCGLHTEYETDTVHFSGPKYFSSCLAEGILVPYDEPRRYFGRIYPWKLHRIDHAAIMLPEAHGHDDPREGCPGCGAHTTYNLHGYFEYGREHKLGNVTMDDYYLFGERITIPNYVEPLCTAEEDYYGDTSTAIRWGGVTYSGERINFPNGWAQHLDVVGTKGTTTYTLATESATIDHVTGTLTYHLDATAKHVADKSCEGCSIILTVDLSSGTATEHSSEEFRDCCHCDPRDLLEPSK